MPTVKIRVLRAQTGGETEVEAERPTVGEALSALAEAHPATGDQLFAPDGELNATSTSTETTRTFACSTGSTPR